jgi:hypothetical protein
MLRRGNPLHSFAATLSIAFALCVLSSCAGKNVSDNPPELPVSDADLLNNSEKGATDVPDSSVFSDLNSKTAKDSSESSGQGTAFYQPIGGESLGRVAYTLYGKVSARKILLEKNPDLKGVKKLSQDQKVFFDIESTRPQPTYLTKDLLNRYPTQLAERLNSIGTEKGSAKSSVTVSSGETLQKISKKLYGTSRYWPEIFLINYDKIHNYDKVPAGISLSVFEHAAAAGTPKAPAAEAVPAEVPVVAPVGAILTPPPAQPAPVAAAPRPTKVATQPNLPMPSQPVKAATPPAAPTPALDPIPETPPAPVAAPTPKTVAKAAPAAAAAIEEESSTNSTMRRVLYLSLVVLILGVAFYFTKGKRRPKFDMLDMTAAETAERPKFGGPKDSQKGVV